MGRFSALFRLIDESGETVGIESYGASITTMDEIFLNVTKDCSNESVAELDSESKESMLLKLAQRTELLKGSRLRLQQFRGAFVKCFLHAVRNWPQFVFQLAMPLLHVILAIMIIKEIPEIGDQPTLDLSMNRYSAPPEMLSLTTMYQANSTYSAAIESAVGTDSAIEDVSNLTDLLDLIPARIDEDVATFNDKYLIALQVAEKSSASGIISALLLGNETTLQIKSFFNADAYHAIASGVLYADRVMLNQYFSGVDGIGINTHNHPLPANSSESLKKNTNFFIQGFIISLWVTVRVLKK